MQTIDYKIYLSDFWMLFASFSKSHCPDGALTEHILSYALELSQSVCNISNRLSCALNMEAVISNSVCRLSKI